MSDRGRKTRGRSHQDATFPVPVGKGVLPTNYKAVLDGLKDRIRSERLRVTLSANSAMVLLYWDIGSAILDRQHQQGWGAKVIDRLSQDLRTAFPDMSGLSSRNLKYMRSFAAAWPDREIVQRTVAQIPWRSNLALLDKLDRPDTRLWYAQKTIENGWSRDMLVLQTSHGYMGGRAKPSQTSTPRCRQMTLTWRPRYSKILTCLISWVPLPLAPSGKLNKLSLVTYKIF